MNIDEGKIWKELQLAMAQEIGEGLAEDPYNLYFRSYLLSAKNIVDHLRVLGFKIEPASRTSDHMIIMVTSPEGVGFRVDSSLYLSGVSFECADEDPDREEEEQEDYDYEEDEYVDYEEQAQNEKPEV